MEPSPRLSWAVAHTERAQSPREYEVMVNRSVIADGATRQTVAWSARTRSLPVSYGEDGSGEPLRADTDYTWAVRWTDAVGRVSPWSALSHFSTALFNESDWRGAEWIGTDGPAASEPFVDVDQANRFRGTLTLRQGAPPVARCSLMIAGLGYYRAWLEGIRLDDHELGESMQFEQQIPYDAVDCTAALVASAGLQKPQRQHPNGGTASEKQLPVVSPGAALAADVNVSLAVELGRGWYGEQSVRALGNRPSGPRMLRCLMTVTFVDGTSQILTSHHQTWRRRQGPVVVEELHLGIVYDARRESPGWQQAGFDDGAWSPPRPINLTADVPVLKRANLTTSFHARIRKVQPPMTPLSVRHVANHTWLVDVGKNIAGWCQVRFPERGPPGSNVTFLHAEYLDAANGTITRAVQPLTAGAFEQTTYVFGANLTRPAVFEPVFVSYAFRYMQLSGDFSVAPAATDVTCWRVHTDHDPAGTIAFAAPADDEMRDRQALLQANYDATQLSAEANWISFPTDCPHRERRGWLGDGQAAAETVASLYDVAAGNSKWLEDIRNAAELMYSGGDFPTLAPQYSARADNKNPPPGRNAVAWSSAFVLVWDWTWRRYNDLSLARRHYERARLYLDHLQAQTDQRTHVLPVDWQGKAGLLGDWCAAAGVNGTGDGQAYGARHVSGVFNTFYFVRTHEAWLRAHDALGMPEAAARPYREWVTKARSGFNFAFYNRTSRLYADPRVKPNEEEFGQEPLQTVLSLALTLGVADLPAVNDTLGIAQALRRDVQETQGNRLTTGLIGTKYLFTALSDHGFVDSAIAVLTQRASPSYQYEFDQGPGTLWESWNGNSSWHRPRGSLNHIMLGSQLAWYYSHLGGIQLPDNSVGWSTVRIAPSVTRLLRGFAATLSTVRGPLRSSWAWGPDPSPGYTLNVSIPVGSQANLTFVNATEITEAGQTVFSGGRFIANASTGVVAGGTYPDGKAWLTVLSGNYSCQASGGGGARRGW